MITELHLLNNNNSSSNNNNNNYYYYYYFYYYYYYYYYYFMVFNLSLESCYYHCYHCYHHHYHYYQTTIALRRPRLRSRWRRTMRRAPPGSRKRDGYGQIDYMDMD